MSSRSPEPRRHEHRSRMLETYQAPLRLGGSISYPLKKPSFHLLDPPLPLHVDVVGPVHHDLADLRVLEQPLDWTEADDFIRDLVHDARHVTCGQDRPAFTENGEHFLAYSKPSLRRG